MSKNMMMTEEFVADVYRLIWALERVEMPEECKDLCRKLDEQIRAKTDRMRKREAFTQYKNLQQGSDEREQARKEYLDKAGIHRDWQSSIELPF